MEDIKIGIDLGGSHVSVGIVDRNNNVVNQYEKDFKKKKKKDLINVAIKYIVETVNLLKGKYDFSKIGLGMAGIIKDGIVISSPNIGIKNFNIKKIIEEKTKVEVRIANDAICAAIGEYEYGNLKQYKKIIFLTLGTGIGGNIIYNGKIMDDSEYQELGHTIIKENGIEGGYTHGKSPKYLIADARSDLTISSEGKVVNANNEPFEDPLLCYFHLKGTDSYGNYSITSLPLKLDPLGEIPDIYLDSPDIPLNVTAENSKLVSGIIRLSGHVNAVNSIKRTAENPNSGVYIQIDPSFNGTFAENWHTKPMPSGKTFAEANYTIVSFGPEEKSKQGIYVDDNLSWAFQLNKKSNFETANFPKITTFASG